MSAFFRTSLNKVGCPVQSFLLVSNRRPRTATLARKVLQRKLLDPIFPRAAVAQERFFSSAPPSAEAKFQRQTSSDHIANFEKKTSASEMLKRSVSTDGDTKVADDQSVKVCRVGDSMYIDGMVAGSVDALTDLFRRMSKAIMKAGGRGLEDVVYSKGCCFGCVDSVGSGMCRSCGFRSFLQEHNSARKSS